MTTRYSGGRRVSRSSSFGGRPGGRSSDANQSRFGRKMAHSRPTRWAGNLPSSISIRTRVSERLNSLAAWVTDTISTWTRMRRIVSKGYAAKQLVYKKVLTLEGFSVIIKGVDDVNNLNGSGGPEYTCGLFALKSLLVWP